MSKAWIVMGLVGMLVVGTGLGVAGALLFDDDGGSEQGSGVDASAASTSEECGEARAVVDASLEAMRTLNESENQDASFFAALIVEQRTVTFAMDQADDCFTLQERAGAEGLLEGIHALLDALGSDIGAGSGQPTVPAPDSVPEDSSSTDE